MLIWVLGKVANVEQAPFAQKHLSSPRKPSPLGSQGIAAKVSSVPHVIVEYSTNLDALINVQALIDAIHSAALATGIAPTDALRTRAEPRNFYRIGDGHPDNAFISIAARLGAGRTSEQKHRYLAALLEATETVLGAHASNVMISMEYQEIDPEFRINKNNARDAINLRHVVIEPTPNA